MANNKFGSMLNSGPGAAVPAQGAAPVPNPAPNPAPAPAQPSPAVTERTYTEQEQKDVNAITVTVPDTQTPIVVFFGPQESGKTLTLLRMIRFLDSNGYKVNPEGVFRPKTDEHYARMCASLKDMVYSSYVPGGTDVISFMLVNALNPAGHPVCQFLEAPGEHYFDGTAELNFPTYINQITQLPNRKVWVFFVEINWGTNQEERNKYARKIQAMQSLISPNDKVVFLFNKADKHPDLYGRDNHPKVDLFMQKASGQYPGIFTRYENHGILALLHGDYNCNRVCFSSGMFNKTGTWVAGKDFYCKDLWDAIMK